MTPTKIYKKNGSVIVDRPEKNILYLNTDDTRLMVNGETFSINDGQATIMYELGAYNVLSRENGDLFNSFEECYDYLLLTLEVSVVVDAPGGTPVGPDPEAVFAKKIVQMNTAETFYNIVLYDDLDAVIKTQVVKEGTAPDETLDSSKTIVITSTYAKKI